MPHDQYENPLISRYASKEMSRLWSDDNEGYTSGWDHDMVRPSGYQPWPDFGNNHRHRADFQPIQLRPRDACYL